MEWVEASGKSLDEARETAADLLGVAEDDAEFVTLSEPKAGLFGRVRGEARVQARVRPMAPPPKRGRRQRPERKGKGGGNGDRATAQVGADDAGPDTGALPGQRKRSSGKGNDKADKADKADATGASKGRSGGNERKSRTPSGAGNGTRASGTGQQSRKRTGDSPEESEAIVEESLTIEQQGEAGKEFIAGLVREFGLEADVDFREIDDETVEVVAVGDDLGLLVGPRGATLAAVQDLTRTFVQRQSENRTDRILVDVGGYREKRSAALRRFTEGIVSDVKESGTERALEPMSAADRKVVHDAVNEIDGVQTRSEGEDPSRYIVIEPTS